ncbi:MAG: hypothetical protein ACREAE_04485, partial [Nitrosopumilaceae archaeon]
NDIERALTGRDPWSIQPISPAIRGVSSVSVALTIVPLGRLTKYGYKLTAESWAHIVSRHIIGKPGRTLFPSYLSKAQIKGLIREAVDKGTVVKQTGERILITFSPDKFGIKEMEVWVNTITNVIETAYPTKGPGVIIY